MTQLELQQRALLAVVKGRPGEDPDLRRLASSPEVALLRTIALWWRAFHLEAQCPFTTRLLKRLGRFESAVGDYFDGNSTSPYAEELSAGFLTFLQSDQNELLRRVSYFEKALLSVRAGSTETFEVLWDANPDLFFRALWESRPLPTPEAENLYRIRIGAEIPGLVACTLEL